MEPLQPTPALEFRRLSQEGAVRALQSSGRVVRQRPVDLLRLLKRGKIPDHLTAYVMSLVWSDKSEGERSEQEKAVEWLDYLDMIAAETLLSPKVVENPQAEDEITASDLLYPELLELHNWARDPLEAVRSFRLQQNGNVETGAESAESGQTAKRVSARAGK